MRIVGVEKKAFDSVGKYNPLLWANHVLKVKGIEAFNDESIAGLAIFLSESRAQLDLIIGGVCNNQYLPAAIDFRD